MGRLLSIDSHIRPECLPGECVQHSPGVLWNTHGWVDLSTLPTKGCNIDWGNSVGAHISFSYDGIASEIIIKALDGPQYVKIDIPNYVENHRLYVGQIKHGQLGGCLGVRSGEFRYRVGDIVDNVEILDCFVRYEPNIHKYYKCHCLRDSYIWELREEHLKKGVGCPVCKNKVTMAGVNDIHTVAPELVPYFANMEDTQTHTLYSNQKCEFRCPDCNHIVTRKINNVARNGFHCPYCSDGISYPNRFITSFLTQIISLHPADTRLCSFQREHTFDWSMLVSVPWQPNGKKMIYDIYIPGYDIIIENQGAQHYSPWSYDRSESDFQRRVLNDEIKKQVALKNGILEDRYICLDCRQSDAQYIRHAIMRSNLPSLLGFNDSDINWLLCDQQSYKSLVVQTWDMSKKCRSIAEICATLYLHPSTVRHYIETGIQCGALQPNILSTIL